MIRFSIRDVLWLMVVGMALTWWSHERHYKDSLATLREENDGLRFAVRITGNAVKKHRASVRQSLA
jgi:hypothetical protein